MNNLVTVLVEFYGEHLRRDRADGCLQPGKAWDPDSQWNPGYGESNIVSTALLFLTCILSELEAAGGYQRHPKLAELWTYLRNIDGEATDLWTRRYEALLAPRR